MKYELKDMKNHFMMEMDTIFNRIQEIEEIEDIDLTDIKNGMRNLDRLFNNYLATILDKLNQLKNEVEA